ncbi:hypothetical protein [Aurantiacibacter poecillastricola]|uniref:hypothetical protein n=1 Tax=Aurantiacibacter poecillastricola TaxID=3064385 RepID=UPI00273E467E|nr:hypothetical protein [Aurantiacibacter sp. 219JJ12-13]MDP5262599.1 hypothetical protein [Aurantiacibacter sp. 219JJ12-13]
MRDTRRLLRRLSQAGIAVFLLISAFDIHRWRREPWQLFDSAFADTANALFGQPYQPWWLYALAFPVVAVNFGCLVQIWRGKTEGILLPFVASAAVIAIVPLFAWQMVGYAMIWERILTALGYFIGGAIAVLLYLGLDRRAGRASDYAHEHSAPTGADAKDD